MSANEPLGTELADRARALAEQALHKQAAGNADEADRLFSEAQKLDPEAVAMVLNAHDAAVAPDARDMRNSTKASCAAREAGTASSSPWACTRPSRGAFHHSNGRPAKSWSKDGRMATC